MIEYGFHKGTAVAIDVERGEIAAVSHYGQSVTSGRVPIFCVKLRKKTGESYTLSSEVFRFVRFADNVASYTCEVLDVENVYFGDPTLDSVQDQPYIIIAQRKSVEELRREEDRSAQRLTSEVQALETAIRENLRDTDQRLDDMQRRLTALENRANSRSKKNDGIIRQLTMLASIICGTWLLVNLLNILFVLVT